MKSTSTASALLVSLSIALGSFALGGCAVEATDGSETSQEEENLTSAQSKTLKDLKAAVVGLSTSGSEADPDPFKVSTFKLKTGEKLDAAFLKTRVLPKLKDVYQSDADADYKPAYQKSKDAEIFNVFGDESSPAKIKKLETLVRAKLTNVQGGEIGYAYGSETGSMDTGAVARCLIGQLGNTVVVIWGIDVWT